MRPVAGLVAAIVALSGQQADASCVPYHDVVERLRSLGLTQKVGRGIVSEQYVLERFEEPDGSRWAYVLKDTNGDACVWMIGEEWDDLRARGASE